MSEIVKVPERKGYSRFQICFLSINTNEIEERGTEMVKALYLERRALLKIQSFFNGILERNAFKVQCGSNELRQNVHCPVTQRTYSGDYLVHRMVLTINQDSVNFIKISNRELYNLLCDCNKGMLVCGYDFDCNSLNTSKEETKL